MIGCRQLNGLPGNSDQIKVGVLGTRAHCHLNSEPNMPDSLMVGINGHVAALAVAISTST
jgi:hypothetical protein